jgi:hypothetical protein
MLNIHTNDVYIFDTYTGPPLATSDGMSFATAPPCPAPTTPPQVYIYFLALLMSFNHNLLLYYCLLIIIITIYNFLPALPCSLPIIYNPPTHPIHPIGPSVGHGGTGDFARVKAPAEGDETASLTSYFNIAPSSGR